MSNIYLNNCAFGILSPVARRGRPLTPAGHAKRLEAQKKKEAKAVIVAEKQLKAKETAQRKEATAKRRQTVANHLMKVYQGKTFTVKDVKKSLALAVRNWQSGCLDAELTVCIQSAGAKIVEKVSAGRGRPANVYSL